MKNYLFRAILFFIAILTASVLWAQEKQYDMSAQVPVDSDVIIGKLDNGLTYYIRKNELPEDRAEFYLVVNAGAVLEDEDQNGLAHFCEHMAFNGTKHFEKHDLIHYLQSIGMKFGPEINAFTSHDVTNYMLRKVPTDVPENIDTSLLILFDWASNVLFEDEEIDKERGVIHEEWRTRRSAQFRMQTKTNEVLFQGSKYAKHDVIGDIEIIDHGPYETLKRFYRDWYRPDLEAVIAVGDFDVNVIEQKITDLFSQIPKRDNPKERKIFEVPDHDETLVAIETDPEARYVLLQLHYKHNPVKDKNMEYYRQGIIHELYNNMLNNRLQELLQEEDPPFIYAYSGYSNLIRSKDTYMTLAVAKNDGIKRTLETMLTENERVKRYGFLETELERAKKEMLSQAEKQYNERDKQKSSQYVWLYFSHFLEEEPIPGIEFNYEFVKNILPGITLEEINALAPRWITGKNRVVVITAPEREDVIIPFKDEVIDIVAAVDQEEIEPYVDKVSDKPLLAEKPVPGKIVSKKKNKELDTEEWILSNGIRVVLKTTDFKDDEILMRAYSYGGSSLYSIDDLVSADFTSSVVNESGVGEFDKIQLRKLLAGKIVSVRPYVNSMDEGFTGSSSKKDFETLLQLVYLYYTDPPSDEKAFNAFMTRMKGFYENRANDPAAAFQDTITVTMAEYHPRVRPMTVELMDEASYNRVSFIFKDRFGDPAGFNFYFVGNLDTDSVEPLITTYLGGLPKIIRNESWKDNDVRPPKGEIDKTVIKDMEVPKGTIVINYTGEYDYDNYQDRVNLSGLCDILDIRYTESIREEQGGTYGVSVYPIQNKYPYERYGVIIRFNCDPENVDKLKTIAYEEIEKIKKEGPLLKDLNNVKENKLKSRKENLKENWFWISTLRNYDYNDQEEEVFLNYEDYVSNLTIESLKDAASKFFGGNCVEFILLPEDMSKNIKNPMMEK